jgi:F-type H+-transporting ATPase subunit delta
LTADSSTISGVAGRYATALFDLAQEAGAVDAVAADLAKIEAMIAESSELAHLVRSPVFSREDQGRALAAVLDRAGIGDLVRRFLGVVAANRRLFSLPQTIRAFRQLVAAHRGQVTARVNTATPLSDPQIAALKSALSQAAKADVDLDIWVDPALIGGVVVQLGSRLVDASVRTKLQNLKNAMKGVG